MVDYKEVKVSRILNPTSIDLGEFVINPYKGCEFGCLYCYVRSNKVTSREARPWGSYVDIRANSLERLKREIALRSPKCVLLGSTTEVFAPIEEKRGLTAEILQVLNDNRIYYVILTRSPHVARHAFLLKEGCCRKIYFTINTMKPALKMKLEPKSPAFQLRFKAIDQLLEHQISVTPYFSPFLPGISDFKEVFARFPKAESIEFEGLNFSLKNIRDCIAAIGEVYPSLKGRYEKMLTDKAYYERVWREVKKGIAQEAIKAGKKFYVYIHHFGDYFRNTYKP